MRWNAVLAGTCAWVASSAMAKEIPREYRSARFLGMGDAGTSLATGTDALYYNPAGINDVKGIFNEIVVVSPQVEVSTQVQSLVKDLKGENDILGIINKVEDKPLHGAIQNASGIIFKKVGVGVMQRAQVDAFVGTDPERGIVVGKLAATVRAGMNAAFARGFFSDALMVGVGVKLQQKAETDVTVDAVNAEKTFKGKDMNALMKEYVKRGNGLGADVGLLWKPDTQVAPRFGLMLRNVGGTQYRWPIPASSKAPSVDKQQLDIGASISPGTKRSHAVLAVDLNDAFNANHEVIFKRLHIGGEISFENLVGLMAGLNQGYPTYGAFCNFKIVRVEAGMYSEELEKLPGDRRSQRAFGRIVVGWVQ